MQTVMPNAFGVSSDAASTIQPLRRRTQRLRVSIRELLGETLAIFLAHAGPILWAAFLGFALCVVAGTISGAVLSYAYYNNTNTSTLNLNNFRNVSLTTWVVQGGIGMFLMGLARGAIAWIATQNEEMQRITLFEATLAALRRWHMILFSGLIYSVLITLGTLGLMFLLRELRLDESNIGQTRNVSDPALLFRGFYVRVLNFVFPAPDSPFREIIAYVRWLVRQTPNSIPIFNASAPAATISPTTWAVGIGCGVGMILFDLLLRLRVVAAMNAQSLHMWAGLGESIRLAIRHFGQLFWHFAVLRILTTLAWAMFFILPTIISQATLFPFLFSRVNSFWIYTAGSNLMIAAGAFIAMIFTAFTLVYEGRFYLRLKAASVGAGKH
ncbi:MAG: hypothetical protein KIH69_017525 [Anaerolineae bacterium]|nr:hypothetical protein [Anaerolineae bacterium]